MAQTSSPGGAADAVSAAKDKAGDLAEQAKSAATDRLDQGKDQATDVLDDASSALHDTADALRDGDHSAFAGYAEAAATQVEHFTEAIRGRSVGELLDEAESFARREPGLFIGGAFLLGVAGARFLKAGASGSTGARPSRGGLGAGTRDLFSGMSMPGHPATGSVANVNRPDASRSGGSFAASGGGMASAGRGLDVPSGAAAGASTGTTAGRGTLSGGSLPASSPAAAGSESMGTAVGTGTATSARSGTAAKHGSGSDAGTEGRL